MKCKQSPWKLFTTERTVRKDSAFYIFPRSNACQSRLHAGFRHGLSDVQAPRCGCLVLEAKVRRSSEGQSSFKLPDDDETDDAETLVASTAVDQSRRSQRPRSPNLSRRVAISWLAASSHVRLNCLEGLWLTWALEDSPRQPLILTKYWVVYW